MKKNLVTVSMALLVFCAAPVKNIPQQAVVPKKVDTIAVAVVPPEQTPTPQIVLPAPVNLSVKDWVGQTFIVLEKQSLFSQYGYELYTCKEMENGKSPIDTSFELRNHRIRCDRLTGRKLEVVSVEPSQTEWIVSFKDTETGKSVFAKTHNQAVKEIVFEKELQWAQERWKNKTVFSRKGVISTIVAGKTGFGSQKIKIQDSLRILDITPGITPLPVNPLWLSVKTKDGVEGFIPVRASWTNVMSDKIRDDDPWAEDIMENDPSVQYHWDATMWELINNHRIVVEMTKEQVSLSWGDPISKGLKSYNGTQMDCWEYSGQNLYFSDTGLVGIENK